MTPSPSTSTTSEIDHLTAEIVRVGMARQLILGHPAPCFVDVDAARHDQVLAETAAAHGDPYAPALAGQAAAHLPGLRSELERMRNALAIEQRR